VQHGLIIPYKLFSVSVYANNVWVSRQNDSTLHKKLVLLTWAFLSFTNDPALLLSGFPSHHLLTT